MIQAIGGWDGNASSKPFFFYARCTAVILFYRGHPLSTFARGGGGLKTRRREKGYVVQNAHKVAQNPENFVTLLNGWHLRSYLFKSIINHSPCFYLFPLPDLLFTCARTFMNSGSGLQWPLSLPLSSPLEALVDVSNCKLGESKCSSRH